MGKIKDTLNKISNKVAIVLISIYTLYLLFSFYRIYNQSDTIINFVSKIWSYSLYQNNNVSITLGKLIVLVGFLVLSFASSQFIVRKLIRKILQKTSLDIGAKSAIENLSIYLLTFIFIIIALSIAEIPLAALTFIGGALALGFGLGIQSILNNFISGIILQIEKPIKVGDIIGVDEFRGVVEEIGARSTKLALSDNSHIIIPNSKLLENKVSNWTLKNNILRSKIDLELSHNDQPEIVMESMVALLKGHPDILNAPAPRIYLSEISSNSIKYTMYFWVKIHSSFDKLQHESDIKMQVYNLINKKGFEIPTQSIEINNKKPKT
jgi:potassium efflux system protein